MSHLDGVSKLGDRNSTAKQSYIPIHMTRMRVAKKFGMGAATINVGLQELPKISQTESTRPWLAAAQPGSPRNDHEAVSTNMVKAVKINKYSG